MGEELLIGVSSYVTAADTGNHAARAGTTQRCVQLRIIFMTCPAPWSYHIPNLRIVYDHIFDQA
jgi:hypothetical protein